VLADWAARSTATTALSIASSNSPKHPEVVGSHATPKYCRRIGDQSVSKLCTWNDPQESDVTPGLAGLGEINAHGPAFADASVVERTRNEASHVAPEMPMIIKVLNLVNVTYIRQDDSMDQSI